MNSDEVICSCLGVTAGMIRDAVEGGARTFDEVKEATGAGSVCGVCDDEVQKVIDEVLNG
ncbi:MAG: (2Fe-2S)-binding protein [Butyrivibrio sp.]|nr:(2Fe-2S)-binding protein [Butyrivibrio sp.]